MNTLTALGLVARSVKFLAVIGYSAGLGVGLLSSELSSRKWAVHQLASPCLVLTWVCGYVLTIFRAVPLTELWVVLGFMCSVLTHLLLIQSARRAVSTPRQRLAVVLPFCVSVVVMTFRPTWWSLSI